MIKKALFLTALVAVGSAHAQVAAYDAITGSTSYFASSPRSAFGADTFTTGDAGAGNVWAINQFRWTAVFLQAGTYTRNYTIRIWGTVNPTGAAGDPVFSNLLGTWSFSGTTTPATVPSATTFTTAAQATPLILQSNTTYGVEIDLRNGAASDPNLLLGYRNAAPLVGTSDNGFFWDENGDGVIQFGESRNGSGFTNGNLSFAALGSAVPEPTTIAAVGLGLLAMMRKRRRA